MGQLVEDAKKKKQIYLKRRQENRTEIFKSFQNDGKNPRTLMFAFRNEYGELFIFFKMEELWYFAGDETDWEDSRYPSPKFNFNQKEQAIINNLISR